MTDFERFILIGLFIGIASILYLGMYAISCYDRHNKAVEKEVRRQGNLSTSIPSNLPETLDNAIMQIFTDYQIINLLPLYTDYINSEKEQEILKGLTEAVDIKLSRDLLEHVSIFYNIDNIDQVLSDKIYIAVTQYVMNHNKKYIEEK